MDSTRSWALGCRVSALGCKRWRGDSLRGVTLGGLWVWFVLFGFAAGAMTPAGAEWTPERWVEESSENTDLETVVQSYAGTRMDLNRVGAPELEALGLFSRTEIDRIFSGRPWGSVGRAVKVLALDPDRAGIMEAVFFVRRARPERSGNVRLRIGGSGGAAWPAGARVTTRVRMQPVPRIAFGAVQEKDPGEANLSDHTSAYLEIRGPVSRPFGFVDHLIVGDYVVRFGQGLLFGSGGLGTPAVGRLPRRDEGARGFSSTRESGSLRGLVVRSHVGRWMVHLFVSDAPVDARVDEDGRITAFPVTGYHRTEQEEEDRDRGRQRLGGGRVVWRRGPDRAGVTFYRQSYSHEVMLGNPERDGVRFRGTSHAAASCDWWVERGSGSLFGEILLGGRPSFVIGWAEIRDLIEAIVWIRKLDTFLYSPHGSLARVDNAAMRNEEGALFGLRLKACPALVLSIVADLESRPWRTWLQSVPPRRSETLLTVEWGSRRLDASWEWKTTRSPDMEVDGQRTIRSTLRVRYRPGESTRFSCDLKEATAGGARGTLARLSTSARFGAWTFAGTVVSAWIEPSAPSLYAYAGSLPGEMRFMQASQSGCGHSLVVRRKILASVVVGLHWEGSRFSSDREWRGIQVEYRI